MKKITRTEYNKIISYIDKYFTWSEKNITSTLDSVWFWDYDEYDGTLVRYVAITRCKHSVCIHIKNIKTNTEIKKFCYSFSEIKDMKKIIALMG